MTFVALTAEELAPRVERVIAAILEGKPLRDAIRNEGFGLETFHNALAADKELSRRYAVAQEFRADLLADELVHIADTDQDAARARNRITARQWIATKLNPKRYGERIDLNVAQTIDIGSTLAEARSRALSARYQQPLEHVQVVDLPSITAPVATDKQSVIRDIGAIDVPKPGDVPSIFD